MKLRTKLIAILTICMSVCLVFGLTGCGGKKVKLSAPTNLTYDGEVFRWDAVKDAESYIIKINESDTEIPVGTNQFGYNANGQTIKITVKGDCKTKEVKSVEEASMTFTYLGKIDDASITISDTGEISWPAFSGATGYEVNDQKTGISTQIFTTTYQIPVGKIKFRVRPIVAGNTSVYSYFTTGKEFTGCAKVDDTKIEYDGAYITWSAVEGASKYEVSINGVALENLVSGTQVAYDAKQNDFTVTAKAIGNHTTSFDGEVSLTKKFVFLDMVTGLKVQNGELLWNGDASKTYLININGKEVEVTGSKYTGNLLVTDRTLSIKIKEISKDATFFSNFTDPIDMFILPAPALIWTEGASLDAYQTNFNWIAVAQASGYTISVTRPDGNTETANLSSDAVQWGYDKQFEIPGEYKITIRANADETSGTVSSSKESKVFTVIRPEAPKPVNNQEQFVTSTATNLGNGFTVNCKSIAPGLSFHLYQNDIKIQESYNETFRVNNIEGIDGVKGQDITYKIKIIGKVHSASERVTLNSKETLDFTIKILDTPVNPRMDGFFFKYDPISNANNGYWVSGMKNSDNGMVGTNEGVNLDAYLEAGTYNLQVCAKGDGYKILPSGYSSIVKVTRISAPYNIYINQDDAEGTLYYSGGEGARDVDIYMGDVDNQLTLQTDDGLRNNMNSKISTKITFVSLVAVANYLGENEVYYMTSKRSLAQQFQKLEAPTQIKFTDTHIVWNQEGIDENHSGDVVYKLYYANNRASFGESLNTSFDYSTLDSGVYNFYLRAISKNNDEQSRSGPKYVNSDNSQSVEVEKLETPDVTVDLNAGLYKWIAIGGATGYTVSISGGTLNVTDKIEASVTSSNYTWSPLKHVNNAIDYTIRFVAKGNNGDGENPTISSNAKEMTLNVARAQQLMPKDFEVSYSEESYRADGVATITVNFTPEQLKEKGISGFRYWVNGKSEDRTGNGCSTYTFTPQNTGNFVINIQALGGAFDSNNIYRILGNEAQSVKNIVLLSNPSKVELEYLTGRLKWNSDVYATEYELKITITSKDGTKTATITKKVNNNQFNISGNMAEFTGFEGEQYSAIVGKVDVEIVSKSDKERDIDGKYYYIVNSNVTKSSFTNL